MLLRMQKGFKCLCLSCISRHALARAACQWWKKAPDERNGFFLTKPSIRAQILHTLLFTSVSAQSLAQLLTAQKRLTPIAVAKKSGHQVIVSLLKAHGASEVRSIAHCHNVATKSHIYDIVVCHKQSCVIVPLVAPVPKKSLLYVFHKESFFCHATKSHACIWATKKQLQLCHRK